MIYRIGIVALFALTLIGCGRVFRQATATRGSGNVITETRAVSGFHAVELSGQGELSITQGDTEGLTIQTDDNLLPLITTRVENGVLVLDADTETSGILSPTNGIKYALQVKTLDSIELSGAGNVTAPSLTSDNLAVKSSGAGNFNLGGLDVNTLNTSISGAGNMSLSGQAAAQNVSLSGLGSYNAGELASANVTVNISGAGSATVWASETLNVQMSGAGSLRYYGSPQVTQSIAGVGSVQALGNK